MSGELVQTKSGGELTMLEVISAAARDPGVDPAKLTALLELKERIDARDAKAEFNQAFARLMMKVPRIQKNGKVSLRTKDGQDKGEIPFARWEDVDAVIRPLMAEEGFSLSFTCEPSQSGVTMTGHLKHIMGHEETSTMQLPPDAGPGRNALQAIGSAHSYGKRYIALDMLNIITVGADDDGKGAGALTDDQRDQINGLLLECKFDEKRRAAFLKFAGAESVETIQRYRFRELVARLRTERRKQQEEAA